MRNYVILNGVNSLTKNGLAINEMPPISKPLMRTQKEEIDGRDGDIITELGYSAYDKEMTIGLFGEGYDINDIIAFFNSSGTVVFSDEPDKYYNYQIINQIDYEKLIKFKTATVVFHCQPFKYKLNENSISLSAGDTTVVNQGNIYAKPILNIEGSGVISISLNGNQIFSVDLSDNSKIVIDTANLEAYDPDTTDLLNRLVIGDYDNFKLLVGSNTITLSGTITSASISDYQRWL